MEIKNLDINILYKVCEELTQQNTCGPLKTDFIYQNYSDIPDEKIDEAIQSLVDHHWLEEDDNRSQLYVTDSGLSKIRSSFPARLISHCDMLLK